MIVIGIILLILGLVLGFLLDSAVLDISYLLEEFLTYVAVACVILGLTLTVFSLAPPLVLSAPPEDIKSTECAFEAIGNIHENPELLEQEDAKN